MSFRNTTISANSIATSLLDNAKDWNNIRPFPLRRPSMDRMKVFYWLFMSLLSLAQAYIIDDRDSLISYSNSPAWRRFSDPAAYGGTTRAPHRLWRLSVDKTVFFLEQPNFKGLLLTKVNDCQQKSMIVNKSQWLSTKVNDCQQKSMIVNKSQWLSTKVNDCQQSLIIFDNLQLLSKIFKDFERLST